MYARTSNFLYGFMDGDAALKTNRGIDRPTSVFSIPRMFY